MAKEHAIIRKLQAVEGLGSVSVIVQIRQEHLHKINDSRRLLYRWKKDPGNSNGYSRSGTKMSFRLQYFV